MTDKLTDSEIVNALSKGRYGGHGCKNCKYDDGKGDDRCGLKGCKIARYALDLINRLQEENERLEKENSTFAKRFYKEGAKDFAKRLKQEMQEWNYDFVSKPLKRMALSEVDNLLKEMVGEDK